MSITRYPVDNIEDIKKVYDFIIKECDKFNNRIAFVCGNQIDTLINFCYKSAAKNNNLTFSTVVQEHRHYHHFILNLNQKRKDYNKQYKKEIIKEMSNIMDPTVPISYVLLSSSDEETKNIYFIFVFFK